MKNVPSEKTVTRTRPMTVGTIHVDAVDDFNASYTSARQNTYTWQLPTPICSFETH